MRFLENMSVMEFMLGYIIGLENQKKIAMPNKLDDRLNKQG